MRWYIRNFVSLLTILVFLFSSRAAFAVSDSSILGSRYALPPDEISLDSQAAASISTFSAAAGYRTENHYGSATTRSNVYLAANGAGFASSIAFYIGHANLEAVNGNPFDWHYFIGADNSEKIYDEDIRPYSSARNVKFAFLWACEQGNCIGGWTNWFYISIPYGMPLCWFNLNSDYDMSYDGYHCSDGKGYAFISFYGEAPWLTYPNIEGHYIYHPLACYDFLLGFYSHALQQDASYTINQALNIAAINEFGVTFDASVMWSGFNIYQPGSEIAHPGHMVVYGDGNIYIDYGGRLCPYVYTWDGHRFVKDNNLLPTSLRNNETDAQDYYMLQQAMIPVYCNTRFSLYSLQIGEFENEHSYIDQVELLAVNHDRRCSIAVTPEGRILTYRQPKSPIYCVDNNGTNRLSQIRTIDDDISNSSTYFDGYKGDSLIMNYGAIKSGNAKLILRDDRKCEEPPYCCIEVQVLNQSRWQTVSVVAPRENWATEAVDLSPYIVSNQDMLVRLYWTLPHRLDYVGLDTSPQDSLSIERVAPVTATHSAEGNVLGKLLNNDQDYSQLISGQTINLGFIVPNNRLGEKRDFVLFTDGYYVTMNP